MVTALRDAVADVEPRSLRDHVTVAAQAVVYDLAHGRVASKQLANAMSPADLTALAQVGLAGSNSGDNGSSLAPPSR